ncbi:hypothetical protein GQ53DRAFT_755230 [Thozetella sp. PMI_491]|nr:hypothetical protein GQ53DRAFT_755230 [Thozetella sp. PMI_491]
MAFGMSLSVTDSPDDFPEGIPIDGVDQLLAQQDLSPQYRAALEGKRNFHDLKTRWCIKPETVLQAKQQAKDLFADTLEQYKKHGQGSLWIFGDQVGPTLLDAHIVPLIARLMDVHREELVPDELLAYAKKVIDSPAYQQVTHGRATLWNISYGRPDKLKEL